MSPESDDDADEYNLGQILWKRYKGTTKYQEEDTVHSAKNMHKEGSVIVEVSLGNADEDDIIRIYDKNGRARLEGIPNNLSIKELINLCRTNRIKSLKA